MSLLPFPPLRWGASMVCPPFSGFYPLPPLSSFFFSLNVILVTWESCLVFMSWCLLETFHPKRGFASSSTLKTAGKLRSWVWSWVHSLPFSFPLDVNERTLGDSFPPPYLLYKRDHIRLSINFLFLPNFSRFSNKACPPDLLSPPLKTDLLCNPTPLFRCTLFFPPWDWEVLPESPPQSLCSLSP